jgi:hypothetical protein
VRSDPPQRIHVIEAPPETIGRAFLSNGVVAGVQRPSVFGRDGFAGVNGAYFVGTGPDAGDVVGAHVSAGELASEPVDGRSTLVLSAVPLARPRITSLRFRGSVRIGGRSRLLDGVNRTRGVIWGCGGHGGDRPTQRPVHGIFCTDASELVQFTPGWGLRTPVAGRGTELVVRDGEVTGSGRPGGGTAIPRDGYVLSGSGDAAALLRRAALRDAAQVTTTLRTSAGEPLLLAQLTGVVSGGPRLLDRGRVALRTRAEGFDRPGLYGRFVAARNPRTLAGVKSDGSLLLVTVDGRRPGYSAGMSLPEAARLMKSLGARDALNLDGGGSTTMVVQGRVVNRPSDRAGERAVGDGVFVGFSGPTSGARGAPATPRRSPRARG